MGLIPKSASQHMIDQFFVPSLQSAKPYRIDTRPCSIKLDQNESPWDWPESLKRQITDKLLADSWNRYPEAFDEQLNSLIAKYVGVMPENILTGPGSNYLIALLLSTLTRQKGRDVIIAQPSFALYEMHCRYDGIPYQVWPLNNELEYDLKLLPEVKPGSVIIFASPNNPVGNVLSYSDLETLLKDHPDSMIIADEAYFEFIDKPFTPLIAKYSNLLLLRTFSKTMGAAGLRIGYIIGAKEYIEQLHKLRLPFLLNHYALIAAKEILQNKEMKHFRNNVVELALSERQRLYSSISQMQHLQCHVKQPFANFLLVRFKSQEFAMTVYEYLISNDILVRNVSAGPGLMGCLRISVGTEKENGSLIKCLEKFRYS